MKDLVIPAVLVVGAIAGIALWMMRGELVQSAPPSNVVAVAPKEELKPAVRAGAKAKPKRAAETASKPAAELQPVAVAAVEPASVAASPAVMAETAPAPAPAPPFPTVDQIAFGVQEEKIVERYGDPALSTTVSDHDHVFETLVYTQDRGQLQTLIRLQDGRVLAAFSQSMPPPVNGIAPHPRIRH